MEYDGERPGTTDRVHGHYQPYASNFLMILVEMQIAWSK